jgi:hypothetical protein
MEIPPAAAKKPKRRIMAWIWISASFLVTVWAFFSVASILHQFYLNTATLAPGTAIRPMGVTFAAGIMMMASIIVGGMFALIALVIGLVQQRWRLVFFSVLAAILTWAPAFFGYWEFNHIVEVRKLVTEP